MKQKKCLFFGKKNCQFSKLAIKSLEKNNFKVKKILTDNIIKEKVNLKNLGNFDYIITYITKVILPQSLIKKAKIMAINFHNSLPKYPGSGGIALTLLNNDKFGGITVHHINKYVDNGEIIYVHKFKIKNNLSIEELLKKSNKQKLLLFNRFAKNSFDLNFIKRNMTKFKKQKWNKKVIKMSYINTLREIKPSMTKKKILRIIKVFSYKNYLPFVKIKDFKFILEKKEN